MEKIIDVDIVNEEDLFEKYNRKKVSKELIEYLIYSCPRFKKGDVIKIVVNNSMKSKNECASLILEKLVEEYERNNLNYRRNNIIQVMFLFFGIIIFALLKYIGDTILSEILLVGGWVVIWSMIELEIFSDTEIKRRKRVMKKLLSSEIVEVIVK